MRKLKLFLTLLMLISFGITQVWGATADVTYDFTGSGWTVSNGTLSNGTVSFTGSGSDNFKMNTGYFIIGKKDAYLTFPTYSNAVEKIVVTGRSGASGSTKMNIYVGSTTVSTETTGSTGTNTYNIASTSQAAGTTYTLKVTSAHNAQITKIEIFYAKSTSDPVLESITISGDLTNKSYEEGDAIDFSGLTATGNYDDDSHADLTSSVEWSATPALTAGLTSVTVTATLDEISGNKIINGLTVTEHEVTPGTYSIPMTNTLWGTSYDGTASGETQVSGKSHDVTVTLTKGGSTNMYINNTETRAYGSYSLVISVPTGYVITAMTFTKGSNWNCSTTTGTLTNQSWTGTANSVTFSFGGRTDFKAVSVTYELDVKYAINFSSPSNGTLVINDGTQDITSGDEYHEGDELTVTATPSEGFKLDGIKVIETGSDPENDVTSTVLSGSTLIVPAYAVTVSATFSENLADFTSLTLSEIGVETVYYNDDSKRIGDEVTLPLTATECSKVFKGWDADAACDHAPTYAPGAKYTLAETNKLYAVYADAVIDTEAEPTVAQTLAMATWTMSGATTNKGSYILFGNNAYVESAEFDLAALAQVNVYGGTYGGQADYKYLTIGDGTNKWKDGELSGTGNDKKHEFTDGSALSGTGKLYIKSTCGDGSNNGIRMSTIEILTYPVAYANYSTACMAQVATPTFLPVAGTYTAVQNVTISCATSGATIYYTTDGTTPSTSSTLYGSAITVDANMTIKAIAVKSEMANSAVATAEYEINLPLSTVDAIFAKAKEVKSTETAVDVTFGNWVVSATTTSNAYVTDGTKGFIIYASNHGFNVGDVLSGTANCKVKLYAGSAELTTLTSETTGLTVTPNGSVDAATKTIAELDSINTGALVVLNGLFYNGSKLVDASDKEISPYNALYSELALEADHVYNITGIFVQYNTTKELAPRNVDDIADVTSYVKVSFDANANDATGDLPEEVTGLIAGHNSYTIPTEKPLTRDAYLQIGWNTDKNATEALEGNLTNITANTTLYAIWTAKETCAITFYDRGNEYLVVNPYQGVEYTIDVAAPSELPSGYTFAGWSADPITTEVTSAELVTTITPASATMSLYAVYTRSEGETVIVYNKVTSTPDDWAGKYLIVYEGDNTHDAVAFDGSLTTLDAASNGVAVEINEDVIAGSEALNAAYFTIAAATTNYSIRSASGKYIGKTANSNGLDENATTVYTNALEIDGGNAVITSSGNPTLRYNNGTNDKRFRYYKSGQQAIALYKQHVTLPTVYYTTAPVNRYTVSFNLAEDEQGSFSDISVVQGNDATLPAAVPTKQHNTFAGWTDGEHVYQASAKIEGVTANIALSATWTENSKANVTFDANGGSAVAAINDVYEGETYNLPNAPRYGTNIFGGWKVGDNVYTAGTEMTMSTPAAAIEYVAQWTAVPEFNAGYWFKVTDASTLTAGQFVMIVAEDADYALGATQNSNNRSADAISKIANPAAAYYATAPAILLLQNGAADDQFGLYVTNGETKGYLYAAASGSNHMKTQPALDVNASWEIAIENGVTTVIATGSSNRNNLLYNSGSVIFSCYTGTSSSVKNVAIYRYEVSNKLQVSYAGKGTEHVQGALVDAGGNVTLAAAPAAPEAEDVTYSFVSWIVDGVEYAPAAEIANITENKVVYAKWNVKTKPQATEIIIPVEDVVASDIHVKENQTVTVEVTEDVTLGNLDLENGAILKFDVTPGATVEANDLILRSSSASAANQTTDAQPGKSSQAPVMPVVNGVLALEIDLRPDLGANEILDAEASSLWYCISAPFDVDINSGFEWVYPDGHRTAMIHNTDFQIFAYDGARRATGISGWKRTSGTMKAGVAHFIGFDNARTTNQKVIRLTAKTNTVSAATTIPLSLYEGSAENKNWNGVANPTLQYIGIDKDIVAFDYLAQDYNTYAYGDYNYAVGSPFFIQAVNTDPIGINHDTHGAVHAPKRADDRLEYCVRIQKSTSKGFEGQMYVRASETASNQYEAGHDMASQCSTTPKYSARIWSENYNMRLGIEEAPLTNGNASYVLGIATPAAGEYTISVAAPKENATLYLTYNGSIIWNLSNGAYTIDLPKGITSGYGLVMQAKAPQVGTDIESQIAIVNGVEKVIINNTIYILRDQQMYDVTGKMVK